MKSVQVRLVERAVARCLRAFLWSAIVLVISLIGPGCAILERADDSPGGQTVETKRGQRIAILLSNNSPAYRSIADEILRQSVNYRYETFSLNSKPVIDAATLIEISQFEPDRYVTIGLLAAKSTIQLPNRPIVFCQVFNYLDHGLLTPDARGVKMLPPFALQFRAWKSVSPDVRSVGLIIGPNHEDLISEVRQAAGSQGIELIVRTVASDKETLYLFRRLAPQIDGFLLLPDNRVLSPRVFREIISYGNKHDTQTVVFNDRLLELGAFMSVTSDYSDIAAAVVQVLEEMAQTRSSGKMEMTPLTKIQISIGLEYEAQANRQAMPVVAKFPVPGYR